jgi:hypothetical protein
LVSSGLRLDELAKARRKNFRQEYLPDLPQIWMLKVTGKHKKSKRPAVTLTCDDG